ncbi:bifunctional helix-turn-helix transcriptional regulator/GNAT family N-acetyltransferase [Paraburkholderia acidipaludis]|uniref:bifunctional helix-turn-helix transcriptional regulator/GNAT family N-acetyltransferase n=1 Tax=Paraburkholderia acidipaludis TaxID=660537 RepID=UPI0012EB3C01|nr:helix-turn-helix domain-containing GNAT family N-acetyltransferase [Paraburkholderia acidipaludis]
MSTESDAMRHAEAVLQFNRFYAKYLNAEHERLPRSAYSLTEMRVLHELASGKADTAASLARNLALDTGYLSRILAGFEQRELISRRPSETDARQSLLNLTEAGRAEYASLDAAAIAGIATALARLAPAEQEQLIRALRMVQGLLGGPTAQGIVTLREPRPGDFGWIVHRLAQVFAREEYWGVQFEAIAAHTIGAFAMKHDPVRETAWIAEQEGHAVGGALVVAAGEHRACVRMLFVEHHMRGLGIGSRLLDECVGFARRTGYATLDIELAPDLPEARRMAGRAGFSLVPAGDSGTGPLTERWTRSLHDTASRCAA